jgi:hypothetical protein
MRPFVKREGRAYDQRQMTSKVACGNPACARPHRTVDEARACLRPAQRVEWYGSNLNRVPVTVTFQPHPGDPLGQRGPDVGSPMLVGEAPGQYEAVRDVRLDFWGRLLREAAIHGGINSVARGDKS